MTEIQLIATKEKLAEILGQPVEHIDVSPIKKLDQSDIAIIKVTNNTSSSTLLLKHVDVVDQKARITKTEEKWRISVQSFENEYNFYTNCDSAVLKAAGVNVPLCLYKAILRDGATERGPLAKSTLLLEYFSPEQYTQHQDLALPQAKNALTTLACFHAYTWGRVDAKGADRSAATGLFPRGGWWRAYLRPSVKFHDIVASFQSLCANFPDTFTAEINTAENLELMQKLQDHYKVLAKQLTMKGDRCLVHGDCKTSNLFFKLAATGDDGGEREECALIDFQWTGAASSGGADVAYLIWSGIEHKALLLEDVLLEHYYQAFSEACRRHQYGQQANDYTKDEFLHDYEIEFLDLFKTCLPQLLNGIDPKYCEDHFQEFAWLTFEYHIDVMKAFVCKALDILQRWDPSPSS